MDHAIHNKIVSFIWSIADDCLRVFENKEFGYWKVTVERPLRKSAQFSAERIAPLRLDKSLATEMEWIDSQ